MRKLIVPFLALAALGCAPAASVVTAPVNAAANVATATTGAAANVATTATGAAAGVATTTAGAAAGVATAPAAAVAGATTPDSSAPPTIGGACREDAAKICPNMRNGTGKCLAAHRGDLSPHCLAVVNSMSKFPNCLEDASRLCPNVTPSGAGFMACLRTRQNDLSESCRQQMGKIR